MKLGQDMAKKEAKFEDLLAELEKLVERLESGELSLDEALVCYENGIKAYKACHEMLQSAEKKVQVLMTDGAGKLVEQPLEDANPGDKPEA